MMDPSIHPQVCNGKKMSFLLLLFSERERRDFDRMIVKGKKVMLLCCLLCRRRHSSHPTGNGWRPQNKRRWAAENFGRWPQTDIALQIYKQQATVCLLVGMIKPQVHGQHYTERTTLMNANELFMAKLRKIRLLRQNFMVNPRMKKFIHVILLCEIFDKSLLYLRMCI